MNENANKVMSTAEMVTFLMELANGSRSIYAVGTKAGLVEIAIHLRTISSVLFRKMDSERQNAGTKAVEKSMEAADRETTSASAGTADPGAETVTAGTVVKTIFKAMNEDGTTEPDLDVNGALEPAEE